MLCFDWSSLSCSYAVNALPLSHSPIGSQNMVFSRIKLWLWSSRKQLGYWNIPGIQCIFRKKNQQDYWVFIRVGKNWATDDFVKLLDVLGITLSFSSENRTLWIWKVSNRVPWLQMIVRFSMPGFEMGTLNDLVLSQRFVSSVGVVSTFGATTHPF